jgi:hypothetical protein
MKTLLLALLLSIPAFAQKSVMGLPVDNRGTPLIAGLGLPSMCEVSTSTATYTEYCQLPANSGDNTGRMFRHIQVYNPSSTKSVYVCLGNDTSCATDMIKIRPGAAISQDFALYGPGNLVTRVWLRLSSAGSETVDVLTW